jgi:hypothetical protein
MFKCANDIDLDLKIAVCIIYTFKVCMLLTPMNLRVTAESVENFALPTLIQNNFGNDGYGFTFLQFAVCQIGRFSLLSDYLHILASFLKLDNYSSQIFRLLHLDKNGLGAPFTKSFGHTASI